ncbi:MAG TPA: hypothetical protein VF634_09360 [Pyrinomonadaceae bacterium]
MRWKLLIITSLVAALLSVGGMYVFAYLMKTDPIDNGGQFTLSAGFIIIQLAFDALAAVFVYRHTARRRKLQAALTVLLSLVLAATIFTIAQIIFRRALEVRPRAFATMHHGAT